MPKRRHLDDQTYFQIMEKVAEENNPIWNEDRTREGYPTLSVDEDYLRILNDNAYNYRGFYDKYPKSAANADSHWPDEFNTVWHPTFSNQSIYSGKRSQYNPEGEVGGYWIGDTFYTPQNKPRRSLRLGGKPDNYDKNLFRNTNKAGDVWYTYQESPDSEEIRLTPINTLLDDPAQWTYIDEQGRQYTPRNLTGSQTVVDKAKYVNPIAQAANDYFKEAAYRVKDGTLALQGKYTMPAIAAAPFLAWAGEAAYPYVSAALANPYVDAGIKSAFAGHGINHSINENVDGLGDAAMTAMELAPLGQLARPLYKRAIKPGLRLFNSPLTGNWTRIGNKEYRLSPNSIGTNALPFESRASNSEIIHSTNRPYDDDFILSPDYLVEDFVKRNKSKYAEDIAEDMFGFDKGLQLVDYNSMNNYGEIFNKRLQKTLPLAKQRGTLRTDIEPNVVVADSEGRRILYDKFINDTPTLKWDRTVHIGDPVTDKGKLAADYYYKTKPAESVFDSNPSSFADRKNNTIVVIPRNGNYENMYKYTVPHEKTHIFIDGKKEAELFGTDRGLGTPYHEPGDTDISLDLYLARPDEQLARGTQIKNYLGITDESPITAEQLKYAAEHYVKDTGYDNNMTAFFSMIKDYDKAAKWLSMAPLTLPFIFGHQQTHNSHNK